MNNIFSLDWEDWHQLVGERLSGKRRGASDHVHRQTDVLLALLGEHGITGTFFIMGRLAEERPRLVREIAAHGHEIALHGYAHLRVHQLSRAEFERDTVRGRSVLEEVLGLRVVGYRAAEFSINRASLWALEVLSDLGFEYDSSIFPIRHRRYGIPGFHPAPAHYSLPGGGNILEFPPSVLSIGGANIPVAGGGYFRLLPLALLRQAFRDVNERGRPFVTYFHPYEFDPARLDAFDVIEEESFARLARAFRLNLHQNLGRRSLPQKLSALSKEFSFTSFREFIDASRHTAGRQIF